MSSQSQRMLDMWDNAMDWQDDESNSNDPSHSQIGRKDKVKVTITLTGPEATSFMLEASSRGISANEFAKILIGQGLFFWAKQT